MATTVNVPRPKPSPTLGGVIHFPFVPYSGVRNSTPPQDNCYSSWRFSAQLRKRVDGVRWGVVGLASGNRGLRLCRAIHHPAELGIAPGEFCP